VNRYYSYLNSAKEIIEGYNGQEPLSMYLKKFFSTDKKYGSKDRKKISHLCYCYFRLGKMAEGEEIEDKIILGLFLCSGSSNEILQLVKPHWNDIVELPLADKLSKVGYNFKATNVFPWHDELTDGIDYEEFCKSFFIQPDLFLRIRPGYEKALKRKLSAASVSYTEINNTCLSLTNTSKVDSIIELNKEAVIQDLNSQRIAELMWVAIKSLPSTIAVWDCCAASGGKSILCYDIKPGIQLTVSDVRESILINLKKRFADAGIRDYKSFVADLSKGESHIPNQFYDLIIADVPCSGSGTWSRTPEQLYFFNEKEIERYNLLQQKIVSNVADYLKPGGYFLYITCSVFKNENEKVVEWTKQHKKLELKAMNLFAGYQQKADTLFCALLYKPL
jgi:16S rRNA (cytosine967-C5)-methyltransferase